MARPAELDHTPAIHLKSLCLSFLIYRTGMWWCKHYFERSSADCLSPYVLAIILTPGTHLLPFWHWFLLAPGGECVCMCVCVFGGSTT